MNDTLAERGSRYGDFATHAQITQDLKTVFVASPRWTALSAAQKESLEMVAHKIGRILNGDPNYADSWHDIVGYAKLVEDLLTGEPAMVIPALNTTPAILSGKSPVMVIEDEIAHAKKVADALKGTNPELAEAIKVQAVLNATPAEFIADPVPAPIKTVALPNVAPVTLPDNKDGK